MGPGRDGRVENREGGKWGEIRRKGSEGKREGEGGLPQVEFKHYAFPT